MRCRQCTPVPEGVRRAAGPPPGDRRPVPGTLDKQRFTLRIASFANEESRARAGEHLAAIFPHRAPDEIAAGGSFEVEWTGPAHSGDYVTIVPAGASDADYRSYSDVSAGSPAKLTAPKEPGDAEIRYVAAQGRKVLERRAIRVTP